MSRWSSRLLLAGLAVLLAAGCERARSSNPLSPSIAGPIAGVVIDVPQPLVPAAASQIPVDQQPITLTIQNAASNGVRPVQYIFELGTDATFTTKIFTKSGIEPGQDGRTSLTLPQSLNESRYYWRAKADDGANASEYSAAVSFQVYVPVIIQAPVPREPADGDTIASRRPSLVVANAQRSGPAGKMQYHFEASTDVTFASKVFSVLVNEGTGETSYTPADDLGYGTRYYWRVSALDPAHESPYSTIRSFVTPAAPVIAVPPPPVPTAPGPTTIARDDINMAAATIMNSPLDLGHWPATTAITALDLRPTGVHIEFSKQDGPGRWPDVYPSGWDEPLQYTLGMCLNIGGQWYCSAVVQFWHGLDEAGGGPSGYANNWFYAENRWGPMSGHQPAAGEMIGFFACSGNCRNTTGNNASTIKERTNVVLVPMPDSGGASFRF